MDGGYDNILANIAISIASVDRMPRITHYIEISRLLRYVKCNRICFVRLSWVARTVGLNGYIGLLVGIH